ncbi:MAG: HTH domain-containing protein [Chloroflexi bacterium]|nr:HTH domain-containing protein [Chloroflexota bacterium]
MTTMQSTSAAPHAVQAFGLDELGVRRRERAERQVRSDALPEHLDYRDDGCDLFPSCLSCPLPRCRYDVPGGVRALLNRERDQQIRILREDAGLSVDEIADRFQVSRRTIFRALATTGRPERNAS